MARISKNKSEDYDKETESEITLSCASAISLASSFAQCLTVSCATKNPFTLAHFFLDLRDPQRVCVPLRLTFLSFSHVLCDVER